MWSTSFVLKPSDARGSAGRAERRGRCVWFFSHSLGSIWGACGAPHYSVIAKCLTFTWSSRLVIVFIYPNLCFSCCFPLLRVGSLMRQRVFTRVAYRTDRVSSPVSLSYRCNRWFVSEALSRFLQVRILIPKYSRDRKEAKDSRWSEQWAFFFSQCEVVQMAQT